MNAEKNRRDDQQHQSDADHPPCGDLAFSRLARLGFIGWQQVHPPEEITPRDLTEKRWFGDLWNRSWCRALPVWSRLGVHFGCRRKLLAVKRQRWRGCRFRRNGPIKRRLRRFRHGLAGGLAKRILHTDSAFDSFQLGLQHAVRFTQLLRSQMLCRNLLFEGFDVPTQPAVCDIQDQQRDREEDEVLHDDRSTPLASCPEPLSGKRIS